MIVRIAIFFVGSIFLLAVILPWNSAELGASPYVAAFQAMGIPDADHIMNAVVLTAVLSCLNSGLYTASRMLFVLAARREAPVQLIKVNKTRRPDVAILASTVVGFLCVIAAAVSPDTVFLFLLNSSGAIILFVYLLIAISQIVLRRRTTPERARVKMWLFPVLSILTVAAILAVLVQMASTKHVRTQLLLSLLAWAVVARALLRHQVARRLGRPRLRQPPPPAMRTRPRARERDPERDRAARRARRDRRRHEAEYFVCVPANPIDTGQACRGCGLHLGRPPWRRPSSDSTEPWTVLRARASRRRRARRLSAAAGAGGGCGGVQPGPARDLHPAGRALGVAALRRRRPRPGDLRHSR